MPGDSFLIGLFLAILILSAIVDYTTQRIPNIVTYPAMLLAIGYHALASEGAGIYFSLSGLSIGIMVLILPYLLGGMGAGDAKLMGAVGALMGPKNVFIAFIYTAIIGGLYALLLVSMNWPLFRGILKRRWTTLKNIVLTGYYQAKPADADADDASAPRLCYGIAIALGTMIHIFLEMNGYRLIEF